jgi:hypothetical protein
MTIRKHTRTPKQLPENKRRNEHSSTIFSPFEETGAQLFEMRKTLPTKTPAELRR